MAPNPLNAAQAFVALLMHGKLQGGDRDYRADHAHRGTPPKRHDNIRTGLDLDLEERRLTRGERKRIRRAVTNAIIGEAHGFKGGVIG